MVIVPTVQDACRVGAALAREDGEDEDDGNQDGALAFLRLQADGVNPVPLLWLRGAILGHGDDKARAKRSKPLRSRSGRSQAEQLPEWAQ